jgi:hypothetical protein
MKTFYMIYVEGGSTPAVKHNNPIDAQKEAERLAIMTKKKTYILKAEQLVEAVGIKISTLK